MDMLQNHGGAVRIEQPDPLVVRLEDDEREQCEELRQQHRRLRCMALGTVTVSYQTGVRDGQRVRPASLAAVAASRSPFTYEVVEEVMRRRHVQLQQREQIRADLAGRKVRISTGSVSNLSRRGLAYLEALHERAAPALAARYRQEAFILHLDGTREGGHWCHFTAREGMSGNVLLAAKIRSEHSRDIAAILRRCANLFGPPDVVISDMSSAICKAVAEVFPRVAHRLCHYHFLRAAGTALMKQQYDSVGCTVGAIAKDLKKVRRQCVALRRDEQPGAKWIIGLVDRVLERNGDGGGEGFPFELPHMAFLRRVAETAEQMPAVFGDCCKGRGIDDPVRKVLVGLNTAVKHYTTAGVVQRGMARMKKLNETFTELRDILHPTRSHSKAPLNWGRLEDPPDLQDVEGKLGKLLAKAKRMCARKSLCTGDRKVWRTMRRMLESHGGNLDPILDVRGRRFVLPRTNNISETGFRDFKRRQRRTTGNANLARQLDHLPPQVFYAENLADPEYCAIVFGGKAMHQCFAQIPTEHIRKVVDAMKAPESVGAVDRKLIAAPNFFRTVRQGLAADLAPVPSD